MKEEVVGANNKQEKKMKRRFCTDDNKSNEFQVALCRIASPQGNNKEEKENELEWKNNERLGKEMNQTIPTQFVTVANATSNCTKEKKPKRERKKNNLTRSTSTKSH